MLRPAAVYKWPPIGLLPAGCLQILEFTGPPGNFGVTWSTALVIGHKTAYQIAYLSRNWLPYFIFARNPSWNLLEICSVKFVHPGCQRAIERGHAVGCGTVCVCVCVCVEKHVSVYCVLDYLVANITQ